MITVANMGSGPLTRTEINNNFLIKWRRTDEQPCWDKLIGAGKLTDMLGEELAEKCFNQAWRSSDTHTEVRVRNRFILTFVAR